jgi:hypothetical protein
VGIDESGEEDYTEINREGRSPMLRTIAVASSLALGLAFPVAAVAGGGTKIKTAVTIQVQGRDFSGYVNSPRPRKCAKDRKVILYKQTGRNQNPSRDKRVATDTASKNGDRFMWSTGNTGISGKFYARVKATSDCKGDTSKTLHTQ